MNEQPMTQSKFTDGDRDDVYTDCCHAVSAVGQEREALFLARLAMLLAEEIGDAGRVRALIKAALDGLPEQRK